MRSLMLLPALAACLLFPSSSFAGGYGVTACFGYENAAWSEWEPSPFATAYTACPGGALDLRRPQSNEGMMVRNVVGPDHAPQGAAAAMRVFPRRLARVRVVLDVFDVPAAFKHEDAETALGEFLGRPPAGRPGANDDRP